MLLAIMGVGGVDRGNRFSLSQLCQCARSRYLIFLDRKVRGEGTIRAVFQSELMTLGLNRSTS